MERIKEAIAKAKSDGHQLPAQRLVAHVTNSKPNGDLEGLEYQNTATTKLNPAHLEKHRIVAMHKNERASWSFDLLRTQVLQKIEENNWRTIAVVSPTPEAGKTVVAINLAISMAQQLQRTTMLVDFDLRRPRVGAYLGLPMKKSLNDFFDGNAPLSEIMVNPEIPRLVILPTRHPVPHSAEMLSSKKVENLVNEIRDRYESRTIIFDLPPILSADDAIALLPKIDCVLLVVGNGMSKPEEIEETLHHLNATNLLGVVLNKADPERNPHYY